MSFAKLFSSITESSLWSESKETRLLFVSMLAKCDATGFVEAAEPGLQRLANLMPDEVKSALKILESPDLHSKNPANEGRRILKVPRGWMVLNYEDYRNRRGDDERREYMREYMRKYRDRNDKKTALPKSETVKLCKTLLTSVKRSKAPLAQAEAEAEAEAEQQPPNPLLVDVKIPKELNTAEFYLAWQEWLIVRRSMGKKPKHWETMFNAQLQWLKTFGAAEALEMVNASIRNNWQGIFERKNANNRTQNNGATNNPRNVGLAGYAPGRAERILAKRAAESAAAQ